MNLELQNKVALVTGGAQGIGAEIVRGLIAEGVSVALIDRDKQKAYDLIKEFEHAKALIFSGLFFNDPESSKWLNKGILILEKEKDSIQHGSGRNSGVIHSGIYYEPGSLRATLGVQGGRELKEYIKTKRLWIDECGKILVPTSQNSYENTEQLFARGIENGVVIKKLSGEQIANLEPNINNKYNIGLHVPFTSIADPKEVSKSLIGDLIDLGVEIQYQEAVTKIEEEGCKIHTVNSTYECAHSFNCSGLHSDAIAKKSGLEFRYSFLPFKGKYWKILDSNFSLKHLVYPVPDLQYPFLGLHTSHKKNGDFFIGPSSTPVFGREQYDWNTNFSVSEAITRFQFCKKNY